MQAGVETCLILGELQMGTDALLSAILSGVLRPSVQPLEYGRAAVTVADIEEVTLYPLNIKAPRQPQTSVVFVSHDVHRNNSRRSNFGGNECTFHAQLEPLGQVVCATLAHRTIFPWPTYPCFSTSDHRFLFVRTFKVGRHVP